MIVEEISFDDSAFLENLSFDLENTEKPGSVDKTTSLSKKNALSGENDEPAGNLGPTNSPLSIQAIENSTTPQKERLKKELQTPRTSKTPLISSIGESAYRNNADIKKDSNFALSAWGLPNAVLQKYSARKISTMFPWQFECLSNPKVLNQLSNLVYSAPTSAGKTLVAEILALKTIFERKKKVIFILPFVSIVREKTFYFQEILGSSGIRVEGFMGSYNPPGRFSSIDFAICTIEKANGLINRLLEENKISDIGCVLVDEMHLLGDPHRGYILELLLTKLRYICLKDKETFIQIVGMSATLPNLNQLATWLGAELYCTSFRPIPLYERISMGGVLYDKNFQAIRTFKPLPEIYLDTDNILQLSIDTIQESCSVLIFCPTKNWCENLAQQLAQAFFKIGNTESELGKVLKCQIKSNLIVEVLEQLKQSPANLDPILKRTVSFGIAFHHAGLTLEERDIIEGAFRNGAIRILIATSTLSSGVNLPARRVLIRTPHFCGKPLDIHTYHQMIGRAGRMGKDSEGESVLICQQKDLPIVKDLMFTKLPAVKSCLEGGGKLKRAILEVIASGVVSSPDEITLFSSCTLLAVTDSKHETLQETISEAVNFLLKYEFIKLKRTVEGVEKYTASPLGKACLSSSIPPDEGLDLFTELERARQCFVLETELHLIYLVTPYTACHSWGNIDWMLYLDFWEKLPSAMKKVGKLVGVQESYIANATRGRIDGNSDKAYRKILIHKRFFIALALQDLVNEVPLTDVCAKFGCNRGTLQSLQQSASTFAGMITAFCRQLGWTSVSMLLEQFQGRMQFGVSRDLLDLMRLPSINSKLARTLYNAGIETVIELANCEEESVEKVLCEAGPFVSSNQREGESKFDNMQRSKLRTVWITGREGLTEKEASELLVKDAKNYLKVELGLKDARWQSDGSQELSVSNSFGNLSLREETSFSENKDSYQATANETIDIKSNNLSNEDLTDEQKTPEENSYEFDLSNMSLSEEDSEAAQEHGLNYNQIANSTKATNAEKSCFSTPKRTPNDFSKLNIIDVCKSRKLMDVFYEELNSKTNVSLCVISTEYLKSDPLIGANIFAEEGISNVSTSKHELVYKDKKIEGFAICWGGTDSYYLSMNERDNSEYILQALKKLLRDEHKCVKMFDAKEQIKMLKHCCKLEFYCNVEDPKVADWLLDTEKQEKHLQAMINCYCKDLHDLGQICGPTNTKNSLGCLTNTAINPVIRGSVEVVATWHLADVLKKKVSTIMPKVNNSFPSNYDLEMQTILCLANMELCGMSVSEKALQRLSELLTTLQHSVEKKAFALAGRRFNFMSSTDVSKIIGTFKGKKISTNRQVLEQNDHPISELVLVWRKSNFTQTKLVHPLVKESKNNRICGTYDYHTATGRITMHDPSIQMVTKDFYVADPISEKNVLVSCRSAFSVPDQFLLVSADYCQLELRILAYLSKDKVLNEIMSKPGDIFKSVAAKWNNVAEDMVDENMRQNTKQLCYGIIYGIGAKTLAEQMEIPEEEATSIMEIFLNTYPGIKTFIKSTVEFCRINGYVETISARRRYLPHINNPDCYLKSQAERQAVNTRVQGSAADIVKNAMVTVEQQIERVFRKSSSKPKLTLHLHDELIYEVSEKYVQKTVCIVKRGMEKSIAWLGYFPVKVKVGKSWGQLSEYQVNL